MGKFIKASHYCLIWTIISTIGVYSIVGISSLTIAVFSSGVILSTINLVEEEMKYYKDQNNL